MNQLTTLQGTVNQLTGVLGGITNGQLQGVIDAVGSLTNAQLDDVLKLNGVNGTDLTDAITRSSEVPALLSTVNDACTQLSLLSTRTDTLRDVLNGLGLSIIGTITYATPVPTGNLAPYNCPSL